MIQADAFERRMLELLNTERAAYGLPLLQLEQNLNQAATDHAAWMVAEDVFSHTGIDGSSALDRMTATGFDFAGDWAAAENIALRSAGDTLLDDVAALHDALMTSPDHRANILNPDFAYIGLGIVVGDFTDANGTFDSVVVTQTFAATTGDVVLDPAPNPALTPRP